MLTRRTHGIIATRTGFSHLAVGVMVFCIAAPPGMAGDPLLSDLMFYPGDDQSGVAIRNQDQVAIAAGGPGYLVVWTDERAVLDGVSFAPGSELSGNMLDIYGQLLDSNGEPIGAPIVISNMGRNQADPSVGWNGAAWFVAFESERPDWYFDNNVYGVRVGADGTVLDEEPILLFEETNGQGAYDTAVTSDGENWLVICDQWFGTPSDRTVRGQRIAPDGSLLDPQPVNMMTSNSLAHPDISFTDGVYMVAAQSYSNNGVYFQRFDTALNPLGSLTAIGGGINNSRAKIAAGNGRFLIVGASAHRVDPDGTIVDPNGINLTYGGYRDVTWTGDSWAISSLISGAATPSVQRIDATGALIDATPIVLAPSGTQGYTAAAGSGDGEAQFAFISREATLDDVFGAHVDANGVVSAAQVISTGLPQQSSPRFVRGPGEHMVVYSSIRDDRARILTQRLNDDGVAIDQEPTVVVDDLPIGLKSPSVAWNGSVYLVIWSDNSDVLGRRIDANNTPIDDSPIVIMDGPQTLQGFGAGAVAAAGDVFVVGGFEYVPFNEPLRYAVASRVSGDGAVIDAEPIFLSGGFGREMTGASFGERAMLAWAQYGSHDSPSAYTQASILSANGVEVGSFAVSSQRGREPDIAVNGDDALVVWHDDLTIHQDNVEGRIVRSDGTMPAGEFLISGAPEEQMFPAAGWDGSQYVVAWADFRHIEGVVQARADIRASRVSSTGEVLDPDGIVITNSELPEDLPAVGGANGRAVILFSALHGANNSPEIQRLCARTLGAATSPVDLNGDGETNGADLAMLLANWGACPVPGACIADMNSDAVVDGADLATLLANWD